MHMIETHGDQAAFVSAREIPWHKLGTVTDGALTAEDALQIAHLDYEVTKEPLYVNVQEDGGTMLKVPDKFATMRRNPFTDAPEVLGVVGKRYAVVQNRDNCEFLNELVGESGAHFETAGALYNGRKVFVSMKAPKGLLIGGHDAVDLYLLATNSHDGTSPFTIAASPLRPVCKNTLDAALSAAKATFTIRHSGDIADKVAAAQEALGVMWDYAAEFEAMANGLHEQSFTDREFRKLVSGIVIPEPKDETDKAREVREGKAEELFKLWKTAETQEDIRGTKWGAYNAVVEWVDWLSPVRGKDKDTVRATRIIDDPAIHRVKDRTLKALV